MVKYRWFRKRWRRRRSRTINNYPVGICRADVIYIVPKKKKEKKTTTAVVWNNNDERRCRTTA